MLRIPNRVVVFARFAVNGPRMAPTVQRAAAPSMANIDHHDDIWGLPAKEEIFKAWNPAAARDYNNFNPFERNDEGQMCDKNGCFPGQDSGYMPPNRPDVSWDIQQENNAKMETLKADPKYSTTGQAGNWKKGWKDNLGPPGLSN